MMWSSLFLVLALLPSVAHSAPIEARRSSRNARGSAQDLSKKRIAPYFTGEYFGNEAIPVEVFAAHQITLECRAKGSPRPKYPTWYKDGERISSKRDRKRGEYAIDRWVLIMDHARVEDSGEYRCEVENELGIIHKKYDVKVSNRMAPMQPIIRADQPGNHTLVKDTSLFLQCEEEINDPTNPSVITWYFHENLDSSEDELVLVELQSCTSSNECKVFYNTTGPVDITDPYSLTMPKLKLLDSGWYTCVIENEQGKSHSSGFVRVIEEPIPDPQEEADATITRARYMIGSVIMLAVVVLLVTGGYCWRKQVALNHRLQREKQQKKIATDAWNKVYSWTKVVLVEKNSQLESGVPLLTPRVTIEKQRAELDNKSALEKIDTEYVFMADDEWEVPRSRLGFTSKILGEGAFGKVCLAEINDQTEDPEKSCARKMAFPPLVAVKMLKEGHSDQDMIDLVQETEVMKRIGEHPNIINILGVCTQPKGQPLYLIVEFASNGNLKDYLRSLRPHSNSPSSSTSTASPHSPFYETPMGRFNFDSFLPNFSNYDEPQGLPFKKMLDMGLQIAKGMEFLAGKRCVHRDLAARNILVTEDMVLKIADFGLARDLRDSDYYRKATSGRLPIKWMAPEAIFDRIYTTQSDVWSYGIVLWEIVTMGDSPFKSLGPESYLEHLKAGMVLPIPTNCPDNFYDVMCLCWRMSPKERPSWNQLVNTMYRLCADADPNVYLELSHLPSP